MHRFSHGLVVGFGLALQFFALNAYSQEEATGFALDRFEPSERGSDWFTAESLDLRGDQRFAAGLVLDYGYKPLVAYDTDGDERATIVGHQFFAHVGGALQMWDRVRFGVNLPVALFQDGDGGTTDGTVTAENATTLGDLRIGADVRLLGAYRDPVTLAGGLRLYLPTGSQDSYTSDGTVRLQPRFMVAGDIAPFTYAGHIGFTYRAKDENFAGSAMGSEAQIAMAGGIRALEDRLTVGPELFGSTVVTDGDAFFARRTTPFEILFGAHYDAMRNLRVGGGFGPGLTRGFGTPKMRFVASIEYVEPFEEVKPVEAPPPSDRDGDGIFDEVDACPDTPGVPSTDPERHGCPPDRDGDGILDDVDACPDEPGVPSEDPKKHGCPPPSDRDGDGIFDEVDACPDEPGVASEDPKKHGCPPPKDRDGDGILDDVDACPDVAGPPNDDPKKHGCPEARIEQGQIKIREQVQFAFNSHRILPESDSLLSAVKKILEDHPEIKSVSVEGHTDNRGSAAYNKGLSQRRAASVVNWLVSRGIDKKRLSSKGLGLEKPIDTNDTDEGRQNNRRVEFHIRE
jgi:outer membrane protein OmpA-like peptidoglycan-associated protein